MTLLKANSLNLRAIKMNHLWKGVGAHRDGCTHKGTRKDAVAPHVQHALGHVLSFTHAPTHTNMLVCADVTKDERLAEDVRIWDRPHLATECTADGWLECVPITAFCGYRHYRQNHRFFHGLLNLEILVYLTFHTILCLRLVGDKKNIQNVNFFSKIIELHLFAPVEITNIWLKASFLKWVLFSHTPSQKSTLQQRFNTPNLQFYFYRYFESFYRDYL